MSDSKAVLAGGCFWGMEDLFLKLDGVKSARVGYSGGDTVNPIYEEVKKGDSGHAEVLEIIFDESILPYPKLLDFFFSMHDPTSLNRQMGDIGNQYRSAIFYADEYQRQEALAAILRAKDKWKKDIVTSLEKLDRFWPAEEYHQQYLKKNPGGYTCHFIRKFDK